MRINKTVIMLMALVAFGMPNTFSAQIKVELTANGVKKIPTKVTLFQDTTMVASQSFTDMAFVLPNVPFNRLKLEARNYQTLTQDYNQADSILKFTLKRDTTVSLNEVVVTATTTMITNGANTKFLNVADGYLGQFHTGLETLEWTPGLMKTNGVISVPGRGVPLIYIDNRRITSQKELKSILSSDISSIEIIREPGGEYPPGTTSVVRIKMKKHLSDYVSLSPSADYTQRSHNAGAGVALNSDFRFNKVSGTLAVDYSHGGSNPSSRSSTVVTDPYSAASGPSEEYHSREKNRYRSNDVSVFAGISYDINKSSRLQAQYSGSFEHSKTRTATAIETLLPEYQLKSYTEWQNANNHSHNAGIGYYLDVNNTTFSIRSSYSDIQRKSHDIFSNSSTTISNPTHYKAWLSYAELTQKIGSNGSLSAGYTGVHSSNSNSYVTNGAESLVDVTSTVVSGYASYSHDIKKVTLSGGLAYTYDYLKSEMAGIAPFDKRYHILKPSASISWRVKDKNLSLGYRRYDYAPQYYQLNPNIEFSDSLNYYVGNPNLGYSKSNELSLNFGSWKNFSSTLEFNWTNNPVIDTYSQFDGVKNAILTRPENSGKNRNLSFDITYSIWQRKYNVYASSLLEYSSHKYSALGSMNTQNQLSWMLSLNARYTIAGKYNLFTYSWYRTPYRYANQRFGHTLGVNVGISTSFLKKSLKVSITGQDLFNRMVSPTTLRTLSNNVVKYVKNDRDGRSVNISISYTFNNIKTSFERDDSDSTYKQRTEQR